jgi:hypothetical protein
MPKVVEAPNQYIDPLAVNIEDATQPMGPLEQGDQALVDAAHRLPEGSHEIRHKDGDVTWAHKFESLGQNIATVDTMTSDNNIEHASTLINTVPGDGGISANISHQAPWSQAVGSTARASGNRVGADVMRMKDQPSRREAQAIKLEVARKIDAAAEQLGHDAVEHSSEPIS